MILRPFWRYYGGKWRAGRADLYPAPAHRHIIEPFAGAAGYALRWGRDRDVTLVEKYETVANIWKWLVGADPQMIRAIPEVDDVADLPEWVPRTARDLVGFSMNSASSSPRRTLSKARREHRAKFRQFEGWTSALRERVATQVQYIRHWSVVIGDYCTAPDVEATWFVDPPYEGRAGTHYVHGSAAIDYAALGAWSRRRHGQVIVCEAVGAMWLPFVPLASKHSLRGKSDEAVWFNTERGVAHQQELFR